MRQLSHFYQLNYLSIVEVFKLAEDQAEQGDFNIKVLSSNWCGCPYSPVKVEVSIETPAGVDEDPSRHGNDIKQLVLLGYLAVGLDAVRDIREVVDHPSDIDELGLRLVA